MTATHPRPKIVKICCKNILLVISTSITSYFTHTVVFWANEWCPVIPWYQKWCYLQLSLLTVTYWAMIINHLWPKMAKNCCEICFCQFFLHHFLFYPYHCFMGQWMMSKYPLVRFTLMNPWSYPMGHISYSIGRVRMDKQTKWMGWDAMDSCHLGLMPKSYSQKGWVKTSDSFRIRMQFYSLHLVLHLWPSLIPLWTPHAIRICINTRYSGEC
jgi:hypothetical protein